MKCQDVCENLSAYLDGELDKGEASSIAAHLMACRNCRNEWEQLNTASALLRELPEIEPPPEFMLGLSERLAALPMTVADEEKTSLSHRIQRMVKKPWYKVAAAAAMFGLAFGITQLWDNGNSNIINHPEINPMVITETQPKGSDNGSMPVVNRINDEQQLPNDDTTVKTEPQNTEPGAQASTNKDKVDKTPKEESPKAPAAYTEAVDDPTMTASTLAANIYTMSIQIAVTEDDIAVAEQAVRDISAKYNGKLQQTGSEFNIKFPRQGTDISLLLPEFKAVGEVSTVPMKDVIGEYREQINKLEQTKADLAKQLENSKTKNADKLQQQINQVQNEINQKLAEVKELSNYININVKLVA
ncbi:zf-HC2 domain-containing protein [Peptococcaceae bacterium 1198_IL3148]